MMGCELLMLNWELIGIGIVIEQCSKPKVAFHEIMKY